MKNAIVSAVLADGLSVVAGCSPSGYCVEDGAPRNEAQQADVIKGCMSARGFTQ